MLDSLDGFLQQQLEFRIQKATGDKMDDVIDKINKLSENFSIGIEDKKSPFRNVLSTAMSSDTSIATIKLFIQCQIGKSGASPIWSKKIGNDIFAIELVKELDQLIEYAEKIVRCVRKSIPKNHPLNQYVDAPSNQTELTKQIHLKLIQLYLGHLARKHTALVGEARLNSNSRN
ncbi:hypothetical protein [Nodularia sp. UHCC 0506]|uniref:hypothetical protein n=1 Tax=Nodularia sp. UHCC 0506 TaxID=3110243 RepID=UPI002B1F2893|nr:hypothetical protein [Nodularia sp. UHCC 0506]MEA5513318.1 hypothetical protein [Nodularia sp. UHCC 0506]